MAHKGRRLYIWDLKELNGLTHGNLTIEPFNMWPSGNCGHIYSATNPQAKRHLSGWAMRNTNNHNINILKKSCLGVLVCNRSCRKSDGSVVAVRPAICDKARRKQIGRKCPNGCGGQMAMQHCKGHNGYPVTHFWRHYEDKVFFIGKGYHDHPRPEVKLSSEKRRAYTKNPNRITRGRAAAIVNNGQQSQQQALPAAYYPSVSKNEISQITSIQSASYLQDQYLAPTADLLHSPRQYHLTSGGQFNYPTLQNSCQYQHRPSWSSLDYYRSTQSSLLTSPNQDQYSIPAFNIWNQATSPVLPNDHTNNEQSTSDGYQLCYQVLPSASSSYLASNPNIPLDFSVTRHRSYHDSAVNLSLDQQGANTWRAEVTPFNMQSNHRSIRSSPVPATPVSSYSYNQALMRKESANNYYHRLYEKVPEPASISSLLEVSHMPVTNSSPIQSTSQYEAIEGSNNDDVLDGSVSTASLITSANDNIQSLGSRNSMAPSLSSQSVTLQEMMEIENIDMGDITNIINIPAADSKYPSGKPVQAEDNLEAMSNVGYGVAGLPALSSFLKSFDYL